MWARDVGNVPVPMPVSTTDSRAIAWAGVRVRVWARMWVRGVG